MKFIDYFTALGFSQREADIYLTLYKLGAQPASTIAKYIELERTYVYKALMEFARKDLVAVTTRSGVKYFFIPDISILKNYVLREESRLEKMREEFDTVALEIESHRQHVEHNTPKITLYE
jgi:sugar-specific transcriptional regulator TrmB